MTEKAVLSEKVMFRLSSDEYQRLVKCADQQQRSMSNLARILVVRGLNEPEERTVLPTARLNDERSEG